MGAILNKPWEDGYFDGVKVLSNSDDWHEAKNPVITANGVTIINPFLLVKIERAKKQIDFVLTAYINPTSSVRTQISVDFSGLVKSITYVNGNIFSDQSFGSSEISNSGSIINVELQTTGGHLTSLAQSGQTAYLIYTELQEE